MHYLEAELYELVRQDPRVFEFMERGSLDGLWYWDLESPENEWMSARFWEVLGYDPSEMPHRVEAWQHMIHPDDLKVALENFERHRADPNHPYDQVVRYRHKNGSTVWVRCRGIAIRDEDGTPKRLLGAHTEITALKESERRLAEKNRELAQAQEELTEWAYAASHDVQTPIRHLETMLDVLASDHASGLDEEGRKVLGFARKSAARVGALTRSIRSFARLSKPDEESECVNVAELVDEVLERLELDGPESPVEVTVGDMPVIEAMPVTVSLVFEHFIKNAVQYRKPDAAGEPARLVIEADDTPTEWIFRVIDNGIGIEPAFRKRVFAAFERYHRRDEHEGFGLGLSLCRRAITKHGGRIGFDSEPGVGSTFYFSIPKGTVES